MHDRKIAIGTLIATLLVSGTMIGVSIGTPARIDQPLVIEVFSGNDLAEASRGLVNQVREEALDADGARTGTIRWNCANGADWHCTLVYGLKGPEDERGTVVATGIFRGFNGESLAVTGGTGAFANVRGVVTLSVSDGEFIHTLDLMP
jgi:hypothetical protein